jgi:hypothetical protein
MDSRFSFPLCLLHFFSLPFIHYSIPFSLVLLCRFTPVITFFLCTFRPGYDVVSLALPYPLLVSTRPPTLTPSLVLWVRIRHPTLGFLYDIVGELHACTITLIYIPPALLFPLYNHSLIPPAENGMFIENGRPGGL